MKVLITGGAGFIGSHVVDNLLARGHEVMIFDHRTAQTVDRILAGGDETKVRYFFGDTRDYTAVAEAVALNDGVIHLAGVLGTQETIKEPEPAVETNILGGLNVFKAVAHYNVPAVYIAVGNHWMNNSYSITKTTAERFAFMFNKERGTKIAVVRGLNAYGPRQKDHPVRKIMPNFILPALRGEEITVYGDGSQVMDMIYVKDLADVLVRALLEKHERYDMVFEAGTGRETTVKEIAEEVIKQVGKGSIKFVPMRPGEPEHSVVVADTNTLGSLYPIGSGNAAGWLQFKTLEEGIKETIEWYRSSYPSTR